MTDAALRVEAVVAGYGARDVLRGVSLELHRGEMLGLLGPNGCGKTTLLRVASGVLRPTAGRVLLGGDLLASLGSREIARRVAVLPQDTGPVFSLPVLEAVLLGRHPWHSAFSFEGEEDLAAARRALAEVHAEDLADRDLFELSGGERQRVLLARALCQGGEVLCCDEPTAHLDMRHQAATFRRLRDLAHRPDRPRSVLLVTHDVNLAAQACDRLALLAGGRIVAEGTPREVVTPEALRAAFDVDVEVHADAAGVPFVVRRIEEGRTT